MAWFKHGLFLHPVHSNNEHVGGMPSEPRPLVNEVAEEIAGDPFFGMAAAQKALSISQFSQQHTPFDGWRASLREVRPQHSTPRRRPVGQDACKRRAAHFFVGRSQQEEFEPVLAIPLFGSSFAYKLPPPGIAFNELDSSTWPVLAIGVPRDRFTVPYFDREARLNARRLRLAPNGSAFVMCARCSSAEFEQLLHELSALGAASQRIQSVCEVTDTILGTGRCGTVMLANHLHDEERFLALKVPHGGSGSEAVELFAQEVALTLAAGQHPNLIQCHGFFLTGPDRQPSMLMDCHALGDLKDYVNAYGTFCLGDSFAKFGGLLSGLAAIHAVGIVHRDIKPENLLVSAVGDLIVADFGVACFADDKDAMQIRCGSLGHVAPEILEELPYDCKVDVFSAGVVLYYLLTQHLPFRSKSAEGIMNKNLRAKVRTEHHVFDRLSFEALDLLLAMLQRSPQRRPTSRFALQLCDGLPEATSGPECFAELSRVQPFEAGFDTDIPEPHAFRLEQGMAAEEPTVSSSKTCAQERDIADQPRGPPMELPVVQGNLALWSRQYRTSSSNDLVAVATQQFRASSVVKDSDNQSQALKFHEEFVEHGATDVEVPARVETKETSVPSHPEIQRRRSSARTNNDSCMSDRSTGSTTFRPSGAALSDASCRVSVRSAEARESGRSFAEAAREERP